MRTTWILWGFRVLCAAGLLAVASSTSLAQSSARRVLYYVYVAAGNYYVPVYAPVSQPIVRTAATTTSSPTYGAPASQSGQAGYYTESYPGAVNESPDQKLPARIRVRLPADAELVVNGKPTTSTGPVREFETPALDPERVYDYRMAARWTEGGINVEKNVRVRALSGNRVTVNFVPVAQEQTRPVVNNIVRIVERDVGVAFRSSAAAYFPSLPPLSAPTTDWRAPGELSIPGR